MSIFSRKIDGFIKPRFRTESDGLKYMECVKSSTPVPLEIWVWPYIEVENNGRKMIVPNPDYENAPYEANVI